MYAENLKKIRKELGLTVAELGAKIGISPNNISSYERNLRCPSMDFGVQLYEKLNINLNWFVSGEGEMFNSPKFEAVQDELEQKVLGILKKNGVLK